MASKQKKEKEEKKEEKKKESKKGIGRSVSFWANFSVAFLSLLFIISAINWLGTRYYKLVDVTEEKFHSLSDQTIKALQELDRKADELDQKLKIIGFFRKGSEEERKFESLMRMYSYHSKSIDWQTVDPERKPQEAAKWEVNTLNTVVFTWGKRKLKVNEISENAFTNTIIKLVKAREPVVCFAQGHGEKDPDSRDASGLSEFASALRDEGYAVKKIQTWQGFEGCDVLVFAGPLVALPKEEITKIREWLILGGRALFLLDPATRDNMDELLETWGIATWRDSIIIDPTSRIFGADPVMPIVAQYSQNHPITKDFRIATILALARGIYKKDTISGVKIEEIAKTGPQSWVEKNWRAGQVSFDSGEDVRGPITVAMAIEGVPGTAEGEAVYGTEQNPVTATARIVVVGDSDFVSNRLINLSGNRDFALNIVNWLAERGELISIRPKTKKQRTFVITPKQGRTLFILSVIAIPTLLLFGALGVYIRRRRG